jgi:transcriptional regulator NrdR family protein
MSCPHDGTTQVLQTRKLDGKVYRERHCERCGERYFTIENAIPSMPKGIQSKRKKPGRIPTWAELGFPLKREKDAQRAAK